MSHTIQRKTIQPAIRKSTSRDINAVTALYHAVCDYLADKPFNPGWRKDAFPAQEDAERYLAADGLYIALDGGKVVGTIALTPDSAHTLFIHVFAVHPEHLRKGIGAALLDFAAKTAAKQGAAAIRLHVWEHNTPAIQTYEKSGFVRLSREDIGLSEYGLDWFYLYEKRLER